MTANEIRQTFLDFFASKGHKIIPSASIVMKNDPTLLFTNAGMNQFKDYFLGNKVAVDKRVTDTQKCLRASGKHNDLEDVGKDTYHHTMFEMLGNWSFGDYFKEEALDWAWELLTEVYELDKDRLYVTIFEGDKDVPLDQEAFDIWKKHLPENRILPCGKADNFWEMGDQGPCGPCSEIHIDLRNDEERKAIPGAELVNKDHPQVIEIWNNVFIQFNRKADKSLENLPERHVDTGMGLERLAVVIQGKQSNYDTDLFAYLIEDVEKRFKVEYGKDESHDIAMRVLADHIRALVFTIADGQLPSNNGAGHVVRRILRRASRYAYRYFDSNEPFLFEMSTLVVDAFKDVFPEAHAQKDFIAKVVKEEESSFLKTLSAGSKRFEDFIEKASSKTIPGAFAFELFDTFGFPIDLTELMASEVGFDIDMNGFKKELEKQKNRSKVDAEKELDDWQVVEPGTEVEFVGYDVLSCETKLLRYRAVTTKGKQLYQLVLSRTPFYPEGGGQVGDTGHLEHDGKKTFIIDTKKENDLIIHTVKELPESLNATFKAQVNTAKRKSTEKNHSVTHLIHAALKRVLGDHIAQKGSFVGPDSMRFDFSHFAKMSTEELVAVEQLVNQKIRENIYLDEKRSISIKEAQEAGAMMLFGEKYGEEVRMITFDPTYSIELCGGTHVMATGEIGFCKIISESSVAAGVRRIEVVTGQKAEALARENFDAVQWIQDQFNAKDPLKAVQGLMADKKRLEAELADLKAQKVKDLKARLSEQFESLKGVDLLIAEVSLEDGGQGKDLLFQLVQGKEKAIVVLGAAIGSKANLWVMMSKALTDSTSLNAKDIISSISSEIKGGGGGQPFFASAGGKNPQGIASALDKARQLISDKL